MQNINLFFNSADQRAPMQYLFKLSDYIDKFDIVIAKYPDRKDPTVRKILSFCYHLILRKIFKTDVTNVNAMKLFKSETFKRL